MCSKSVVFEIFPRACSLLDYARRCATDPSFVDALYADAGLLSSIRSYCEETLVVPEVVANEGVKSRQGSQGSPSKPGATPSLHLIEVVTDNGKQQHYTDLKIKNVLNRFITTSIRSNPHYRDRNVLSLGYRTRSDLSTAGMRGNIDIECEFANTMHSFICNRTWQLLIDHLGEAFVLHLFLKPVFVPSTNGCYVQVAGIPVFQMAHKVSNSNSSNLSRTFFFKRKDTSKEVKSLKRKVATNDANKSTSAHANGTGTIERNGSSSVTSNMNSNSNDSLRALLTKKMVCSVQGSTQLPRFDIFYKHTYQERMAKFSKNSCTHSAFCLLKEAFGLLPTTILNSGQDYINSPLIFDDINTHPSEPQQLQLDGVMAMKQRLLLMFEAVVRNYRKISIRQTFIDFCSSTDSRGSNDRDNGDDAIPFKRTRRGARAGVREQKRKERHTVRNRDENLHEDNENDDKDDGVLFVGSTTGPLPFENVGSSAILRDGKVVSVGSKLFKRQLRNIRGSGIGTEDYISQGDVVDSVNLPSLSTASVVAGSSNANVDPDGEGGMDVVALKPSPQNHSSNNEFLYNIDPSSASQESNENVPMQQSAVADNTQVDATKKAAQSFINTKEDASSTLSNSMPSMSIECGIRRHFNRAMPTLASLTPSTGLSRDHRAASVDLDIVGTAFKGNSNGKGSAVKKRRMASSSAFDGDKGSTGEPAKKNYFDKCVSKDDVSSFIKSVCRRSFSTQDVWGSRHNMDSFLSNIDSYIRLGRNDTLTIEQIMKKIRIKDIPWLQVHAATEKDDHCIFTSKVKMILLRTFFYWIICDFVNSLISMHFYVTEGEGMGSVVLFYSRSVWNQVVVNGFRQIQGQFVKMADYSISQHKAIKQNFNQDSINRIIPTQDILRNIEPANTRFMPKKTSVRLITNMGSKKRVNGGASNSSKNSNISSSYHTSNNTSNNTTNSTAVSNSALYNCLHVLKHTHQMNPSLSGFGVFSIDEIYKRLLHFRQRVQFDGTQPLYVAVLDLEKCYDNVDTSQLYDLVCTLLDTKGSIENDLFCALDVYPKVDENDDDFEEEEDCILHKYHVTHRINSMERVITKTVRHVSCEGEMFTFDEASGEIAECYRNSIITDTVQYPRLSKEDILKTIRGHLFNHVVKIPDISNGANAATTTEAAASNASVNAKRASDHYTQVKGIPQGSVLSPLLCNLYYGHAERKVFGSKDEIQVLGIRDKSLIMRMMDDYIMISLDKDAVTHFLQRAHQSLKPYGGGVNYLKTRVNFDTAIEIEGARLCLRKIDSSHMPWCGFFVDTVTMEATPSFDRVMGNHLRYSTSIDCTHIGFALRRVMKTFVRMKCHAIVLDSVLNSYNTVFKTVYEIFLVAAIRTHAFILHSKYFRAYNNTDHLLQCIIEAVLFGARLIHSRTAMKKSRTLNLGQDDQKTAHGSLLGHQVDTYKSLGGNSTDGNNNTSDTTNKNGKSGDLQSEQVSGSSGCEIPYIQAQWLGYRAFESAFNVKRSLYAPVLVQLKKKRVALKHTIETEMPLKQENKRTLLESNATLLKDV